MVDCDDACATAVSTWNRVFSNGSLGDYTIGVPSALSGLPVLGTAECSKGRRSPVQRGPSGISVVSARNIPEAGQSFPLCNIPRADLHVYAKSYCGTTLDFGERTHSDQGFTVAGDLNSPSLPAGDPLEVEVQPFSSRIARFRVPNMRVEKVLSSK